MSAPNQEAPQVLIVDDEQSVRSALRRALRKEPYRLAFAESAADALTKMREARPDVLLTDHLMPKMTGLDLVKRTRLLYPDVSRVILTGQAEMDTVVAAINDGEVFRFLQKPWDDDELKLVLHLACEAVKDGRESHRRAAEGTAAGQIRQLEAEHPGIGAVHRDAGGAIVIDDEDIAAQA